MSIKKCDREKNIYNIISIVKLAILFFCAIVIYNEFFNHNNYIVNTKDGYYNVISITLLTFLTGTIYWIWTFSAIKIFRFKYIKIIEIIESFIFIAIFATIIIKSSTYMSQYKFLFLFIIITSTIELGMKCGMTIALVSSVIILAIDLVYAPVINGINMYFQNDLIIAGVFILTAWPLGYYVKIENENLKEKESQLKILNGKLSNQYKQRKYIEDMLLKNEECYNLLIQNSKDSILVHRKDKLIFANESALRLLGYNNQKDLTGKSISDFTSFLDKDEIREKFKKLCNKEVNKIVFEDKIIKNDKEVIITQNTSTYFIYEGKLTILTIIHDITSEKQVEKLQKDVKKNIQLLNESREINKLITEFLANISHELKTPLNVIFSGIQLLDLYNTKDEKSNNKQKKCLKTIKQNCYRLMRLINNLLDITKLDSGFIQPSMRNCNIVSVVEDITLSVASYVETKGIELIFDTNVEEKVMAFDPNKMERIILNLLSNAIKFTKCGGSIYVKIKDNINDMYILVKDTGVGIPEDKMELIFERFGQVDKTFRRNREGSGIGLYLVKAFVEMHGGTIKVNSKLGEGSEFIIKLPVKKLEYKDCERDYIYNMNREKVNIEFSDIYI
ncbi:sensor histidine kinase TodS [Clostridium acetireducens DSM 10703]|jgi:PAS domain S-box-containing protein|uniref:histidine kinase n=1 Tax=Clostridium acetireducens DSM 10703 TaxID=1121290 RepID=A0A1E8EXZ7_9CLOT|nr:PAS domain-containing sensor histidine kinase [Clostridium acetireducens]OFI05842.1 sensor histidine kinase TodS [Clostridium acetireducens DSM 10703]